MTDSHGNTLDGFRLQSLYQGLETRICDSRKNPGLGKLVNAAQVENQRTREAIDKARQELFNRVLTEGDNSPTQCARRIKFGKLTVGPERNSSQTRRQW